MMVEELEGEVDLGNLKEFEEYFEKRVEELQLFKKRIEKRGVSTYWKNMDPEMRRMNFNHYKTYRENLAKIYRAGLESDEFGPANRMSDSGMKNYGDAMSLTHQFLQDMRVHGGVNNV